MHEPPAVEPDPLALEALALRYAAGDLSKARASAFEARLADDQDARDALSEAVRLSAAALGQSPPAPDRSFRALIRDRLRPLNRWSPRWLTRRAYRGHPLAWGGLGAGVAAAAAILGLSLAEHPSPPTAQTVAVAETPPSAGHHHDGGDTTIETRTAIGVAPPQDHVAGEHTEAVVAANSPGVVGCHDEATLKEAEIWAELSTPDHVEKAHEEDLRWRQRMRGLHPGHPDRSGLGIDSHAP